MFHVGISGTIIFIFFLFYTEHAKNVHYTDMPRPVIEEDIVKAIKFKLNNEEQAWKKQHDKTVLQEPKI